MIPTQIQYERAANQLVLTWPGVEAQRLTPHRLRCDCRCAGCVDENTGRRILDVTTVPADIRLAQVRLVGNYALHVEFSDHHDTGLFTWEHLRELTTTHPHSP